ncbi:DUF3331 domain-containing protein [Cupriavidus sp. CP313]
MDISYGEKAIANRTGICALSGTAIRRGDAIFRPSVSKARPPIAFGMILAIYIDCPRLVPGRIGDCT